MNIVIVSPSVYVFGGAEVLMLRLMEFLKRDGHDVAFITTNMIEEYRSELEKIEVRILAQPFIKHKSTFVNLYQEAKIINRLLAENRFDVINVHNFPANLLFAKQNAPIVWMCNEPTKVVLSAYLNMGISNYRYWVARMILWWDRMAVRRYIDATVVSDEYNQNRYETLYGTKARIINYGIDYPFFSAGTKSDENDGIFRIVQVGMITELKNQLESVRVLEKLKKVIPNIRLIFAGYGEGEYYQALRKYVEDRGLHDNIEFLGHVNREKVRELYGKCDVMLHPVKEQGGWLSPFEAVSAQIPAVVSKELTASAIIAENDVGYVTDDYASVIEALYRDGDKRLVEKSEWVRENLSWDRFSSEMLKSFYKAVKR